VCIPHHVSCVKYAGSHACFRQVWSGRAHKLNGSQNEAHKEDAQRVRLKFLNCARICLFASSSAGSLGIQNVCFSLPMTIPQLFKDTFEDGVTHLLQFLQHLQKCLCSALLLCTCSYSAIPTLVFALTTPGRQDCRSLRCTVDTSHSLTHLFTVVPLTDTSLSLYQVPGTLLRARTQ
jgi:hypothetical protein